MKHPLTWWAAIAHGILGTAVLWFDPVMAARLAAWSAFFMAWACYERLTTATRKEEA